MFMGSVYLRRVVDEYIDERLGSSGAILIEGAKWCGKTRTAQEKAASILFMQDPDEKALNLRLANNKPSLLLEGETPRLIDEWQIAPVLWDAVRFAVDKRGMPGQFILTGSSVPQDDSTRHSGTGRISRVLMRPMSLFESQESNGSVPLSGLFESSSDIGAISNLSFEELTYALVRGGWPDSLGSTEKTAIRKMQDYIESMINLDISKTDNIKRNPDTVYALLRSLSRNVSATVAMSTICKDMKGDDDSISEKTISEYINALRRLFIVEDLPAWNPSLRSKTAVRTSPKRHFVDPSIAVAVMEASSKTLLKDLNTLGLLFESMCVRDLRVYAQALNGSVYHFRDKNGLEADAIIRLRDGRWAAIEVKLGDEIDKGAKNLLKLKDNVDTDYLCEPSFLMVVTATGYAYQREDGVLVVPIGCLRD